MYNVTPVRAFSDNYIWVISTPDSTQVAVVDPGDAAPVQTYLDAQGLSLCAILITHHHNDHTGGVAALTEGQSIPVYGPASSPFKGINRPLKGGDRISLLGTELEIAEVPGHTLDHISYFSRTGQPQLFCGDTLFLAGCGRLFEGTAEQMLNAMNYFAGLPDDTEVYCTHEYSLANLAFAEAVEPGNHDIEAAIEQCTQLRHQDKPTLPSNLAQEKRINPFMRTDRQSVINAANRFSSDALHTQTEVFAAIREWKNQF
ncbi:hydroxyacylglutathione hydrolase [Neptuniibacter halophilus]|uniref:hydroxyacylglutathione hydrolase n=1 Tax=Neptuniibacter halophilus TaxID=651666 RepID=UPI0025728663|nr:hydroxyacylglutathione hydrolase [Neptuniibacter halophilus]